jgi:NAD(P)-dependent dehydrogenase (short-subunit alcohol dehydrogenase family)
LDGKRVIIAGGAAGIGGAVAERLAAEGAKLLIGDINRAALDATLERIAAAGGTAKGVDFDLADPDGAPALAQACIDAYGGIDGLANIAADLEPGRLGAELDLLSMDDESWRWQFDCNQMGYVRTIRAVLPAMIAQGGGSIVNTSSVDAHVGAENRVGYAGAKAAINAITRHVARRWGRDDIRCNSIMPGVVLSETVIANVPEEKRRGWARGIPLKRAGQPSELAPAYAFLLSDDAAWITGQAWTIDGGMTMRE